MTLTVGQVATKVVHVVKSSDTIRFAAQEMVKHNIGALLVVDEKNVIVGIVTERDVTKALALGLENGLVKDIMTSSVLGVSENVNVTEALEVMLDHGFRHLPVVDKNGKAVGIVSIRDLASAVISPHEMRFRMSMEDVKGTSYICPVCGHEIDEFGYCGCGTGSG
ncbi:MAG: CBS domain-containing protein [Sulfolobus sp.]|nr:CBS domain-containing protein [Sulfolobus sp.]